MAHVRILNHYLHTKFIVLGGIEFAALMGALYLAVDVRNYFSETVLFLESPLLQSFLFALVLNCCSLAMGV